MLHERAHAREHVLAVVADRSRAERGDAVACVVPATPITSIPVARGELHEQRAHTTRGAQHDDRLAGPHARAAVQHP